MTFYFNRPKPEKNMSKQANNPLTNQNVKFTVKPVSNINQSISNSPEKLQEINSTNKTEQKHLKEKNRKICKELIKRLSNQKLKQKLHQLNQEYKSKDKNDTDDSED